MKTFPSLPKLFPFCVSIAFACGGDSSSETGATASMPAATSMTDGTDGATAGTADETVGPQPLDRGVCDRVEQCLYDTGEAVTAFLAVYGEGGTCWEEFPAEACRQDCRAMLDPFHTSECPETPSCCHCEGVEDCTDHGEDAACSTSHECIDAASTCLAVQPRYEDCLGAMDDDHWEFLCVQASEQCADEADAFADCIWQCMSDSSCATFDNCPDLVSAVEVAQYCVWEEPEACQYYESMVGTCVEELYALGNC
jgi:hypothetical protein